MPSRPRPAATAPAIVPYEPDFASASHEAAREAIRLYWAADRRLRGIERRPATDESIEQSEEVEPEHKRGA